MFTIYVHIFPNGKKYVGQTRTKLYKRFGKNGNNYISSDIKSDIDKYGWNNIQHIILEKNLTYEEAQEKEKFYISLFKSNNPKFGYNKQSGGGSAKDIKRKFEMTENRKIWYDSLKGHSVSKETRINIRNAHIKRFNRFICQYKGNLLIKKWDLISDINKEFGYDISLICRTCKYNKNTNKKRSAYGFIWEFEDRE